MHSILTPRRVVTLVATVVAALGLGLSLGAPAQAANTTFFTGFESGEKTMEFTAVGAPLSFVDSASPRVGTRRATMTTNGSGFTSVQKNIVLPASSVKCVLEGSIKPEFGETAINLEVIDAQDPAHLTYIALRTLNFSGASAYQNWALVWDKGLTHVLIRFSMGSRNGGPTRAGLDNVAVSCI